MSTVVICKFEGNDIVGIETKGFDFYVIREKDNPASSRLFENSDYVFARVNRYKHLVVFDPVKCGTVVYDKKDVRTEGCGVIKDKQILGYSSSDIIITDKIFHTKDDEICNSIKESHIEVKAFCGNDFTLYAVLRISGSDELIQGYNVKFKDEIEFSKFFVYVADNYITNFILRGPLAKTIQRLVAGFKTKSISKITVEE